MTSLRSLLRVPSATEPAGRRSIREIDPRSTPGFDGDKSDGKSELADTGEELAALQERLFAEGRAGGRRRVVLVLQAMDAGGKDGAIKHVLGPGRPGWRPDHLVRAADGGGARARLPVAGRSAPCRRPASSACSTAATTRTC